MKLNNDEIYDDNWMKSDWYKEWIRLSRLTISSNSPVGYWVCEVNKNDEVSYRYIKNN